jgi:hypothetical protein
MLSKGSAQICDFFEKSQISSICEALRFELDGLRFSDEALRFELDGLGFVDEALRFSSQCVEVRL